MSIYKTVHESMVRFIRASYPNAVIDEYVTEYRNKLELDFLPHPNADVEKPYACVWVPGYEFKIVKEF